MAVIKCKMCGGTLNIQEGTTVCECEYCGSQQTIPTTDDEALQGLFNRANILRMKSEFDKAAELYEKIIQANETEAEAYWGLILCKYGIEYVEDPATYKRVPTCHRASFDAVTADEDYKNAVRYADLSQKSIYEEEAAKIEEIQKGIITLAQKEEPYDVFICYKETDETGNRTVDSVLANDIYHQLTSAGYKVFYAAITLEDKLGQEYEPYIFSALHSSKVMLVLGTKPEYFSAVWVKNEWSRFLKLMKTDRSKLLIPCYRNMDAYELPEEFAHLQAQDMAKIGFVNDIIHGIKKVVAKDSSKMNSAESATTMGINTSALLKRGNMALEDKDWDKADNFFDKVLNNNAECAEAYLGKAFAGVKVSTLDDYFELILRRVANYSSEKMEACSTDKSHIDMMAKENEVTGYYDADKIVSLYDYDDFYYEAEFYDANQEKTNALKMFMEDDKSFVRALQFADDELKKTIEMHKEALLKNIDSKIEKALENNNIKADGVQSAYAKFLDETDSIVKARAEEARRARKADYTYAIQRVSEAKTIEEYEEAIKLLSVKGIIDYKEARAKAEFCRKRISEINRDAVKSKRKQWIIMISASVLVIALGIVYSLIIMPMHNLAEKKEDFKEAQIGDIVTFGTYKYAYEYYKSGPISWRILDKKGDKILIISEYGLDAMSYGSESTWAECGPRTWLNDDFYNDAFSDAEKSIIETTSVSADKNPKYDKSPGKATEDKVFLLSIKEANKYFKSDKERRCEPTEYAVSNSVDEYEGYCYWWLRSPGEYDDSAACVSSEGEIDYSGVSNGPLGVRPALWINVNP